MVALSRSKVGVRVGPNGPCLDMLTRRRRDAKNAADGNSRAYHLAYQQVFGFTPSQRHTVTSNLRIAYLSFMSFQYSSL